MKDSLLIEHLKEFYIGEETQNFNILDFVGAFGSPLLALAYAKLFCPVFIEYKGMIFLSDSFSKNAREKVDGLLRNSHKKQEIEKSFNSFEIPSYFFNKNAGDTYDEEDYHLAEILKQTWGYKLKTDFPDRKFHIEILSTEETGGEVSLILFQETAY